MPKCPECGKENPEPVREWVGEAKTTKPMTVRRFVCSSCRTGFVLWVDGKTGETKIIARKG